MVPSRRLTLLAPVFTNSQARTSTSRLHWQAEPFHRRACPHCDRKQNLFSNPGRPLLFLAQLTSQVSPTSVGWCTNLWGGATTNRTIEPAAGDIMIPGWATREGPLH